MNRQQFHAASALPSAGGAPTLSAVLPLLPLLPLLGALSAEPPAQEIVVYTMGPGEHVFERFGHAAICIEYPKQDSKSQCFNYGTTDFQTPPQEIGWDFIQGDAKFWVSVWPKRRMLAAYIEADRDLYRQVLPLTPEQAARIVARLNYDQQEDNRYYLYHHFDDNCTTRLRDIVDQGTQGKLLVRGDMPVGTTLRALGASGLAELPEAIAAGQLFAGRRLDEELTLREAMFLPDYLRSELAEQFGARPTLVHRRGGREFARQAPGTWHYFAGLGAAVTLPLGIALRLRRLARPALWLAALVLGGLGLAIWVVALVAEMRELRLNEALLVFWPTDLCLAWLSPRARRSYARLRAVVALSALLLLLVGVLHQPLGWPVLVVLLPCVILGWFLPADPQSPELPGAPRAASAPGPN